MISNSNDVKHSFSHPVILVYHCSHRNSGIFLFVRLYLLTINPLFMQRGIVDISVLDKEIDSLNRFGIIINLVMKCLLNESADEVTKGILSVREIYRTVRDSDEISGSLVLDEIEKVLDFLSSPMINGVGKSKDGYCAVSSLEEIGQRFTYYSKCCKTC